jgi:hypothetical protein
MMNKTQLTTSSGAPVGDDLWVVAKILAIMRATRVVLL